MKYLLLFMMLIFTSIAHAAPDGDGLLIKQEVLNRFAVLQTLINDQFYGIVQLNVDNYEVGDKTSTALVGVTLKSRISQREIYKSQFKLNITHGPEFMLNNVKTNGLALVSVSFDSQDMRGPKVTFLQVSSIIEKDSPDWKFNFITPKINIGPMVNWDGASGQLILNVKNSKVMGAAFVWMMQKLVAEVPGRFHLELMPLSFKAAYLMSDEKNLNSLIKLSIPGMLMTVGSKKVLSFKSVNYDQTFSVKDNILNDDELVAITGVESEAIGLINSIPNANVHVQVKNIKYDSFNEAAKSTNNTNDDPFPKVVAFLTPSSELDLDANVETNLGNFTSSVKLTLNAIPKPTESEFSNAMDVNVNLNISAQLLNAIISMANEKRNKASAYQQSMQMNSPPTGMNAGVAQKEDLSEDLAMMVKSGALVQTKDGYSFTFTKQKQNMLLNGNAQSPYLDMLRMNLAPPTSIPLK